jgi:hypothetical protein
MSMVTRMRSNASPTWSASSSISTISLRSVSAWLHATYAKGTSMVVSTAARLVVAGVQGCCPFIFITDPFRMRTCRRSRPPFEAGANANVPVAARRRSATLAAALRLEESWNSGQGESSPAPKDPHGRRKSVLTRRGLRVQVGSQFA